MLSPPVIIVGHIRSGTTVFARLLRAFCPRALPLDNQDFEDRYFWSKVGAQMGSPLTGTFCTGATSADVTPCAREVTAERLASVSAQDNHIISKNPHLSNKIGFVHELMPEARLVVIVRQDLSVIASTKQRFEASHAGNNALKAPFHYYWPEDDGLPCWSCLRTDGLDELKATLRGILHRSGRTGAVAPIIEHEPLRKFRKSHTDRTRYYPGQGFRRIVESWLKINSNIVRQCEQLPKQHAVLTVNYEHLVKHTRDVLRCVAKFSDAPEVAPSRVPTSLDMSRGEKWKTTLSSTERRICCEVFEEFCEEVKFLEGKLPGPLFVKGS
jgi:hypothetical protein